MVGPPGPGGAILTGRSTADPRSGRLLISQLRLVPVDAVWPLCLADAGPYVKTPDPAASAIFTAAAAGVRSNMHHITPPATFVSIGPKRPQQISAPPADGNHRLLDLTRRGLPAENRELAQRRQPGASPQPAHCGVQLSLPCDWMGWSYRRSGRRRDLPGVAAGRSR